MTHYETLGIAEHAADHEIRHRYLVLAEERHPKRTGSPDQLRALNEAYDVLRTPERRADYDERLAAFRAGEGPSPDLPGTAGDGPGASAAPVRQAPTSGGPASFGEGAFDPAFEDDIVGGAPDLDVSLDPDPGPAPSSSPASAPAAVSGHRRTPSHGSPFGGIVFAAAAIMIAVYLLGPIGLWVGLIFSKMFWHHGARRARA